MYFACRECTGESYYFKVYLKPNAHGHEKQLSAEQNNVLLDSPAPEGRIFRFRPTGLPYGVSWYRWTGNNVLYHE